MSPFYLWLERQQDRTDNVGDYARRSVKNTRYPRLSSKLHVLLKYEQGEHRHHLKQAHREWRHLRDGRLAA